VIAPTVDWELLAQRAWAVRAHARVHGRTPVGAAVLSAAGEIHAACNVEHALRSHDVHAEVNALTSMVAAGDGHALALIVVADRERLTPCGACLDWIFELGGAETLVGFQRAPETEIAVHRADALMPFYPR
jgi:cytidine deaminase